MNYTVETLDALDEAEEWAAARPAAVRLKFRNPEVLWWPADAPRYGVSGRLYRDEDGTLLRVFRLKDVRRMRRNIRREAQDILAHGGHR
jgi:hypothetical protein